MACTIIVTETTRPPRRRGLARQVTSRYAGWSSGGAEKDLDRPAAQLPAREQDPDGVACEDRQEGEDETTEPGYGLVSGLGLAGPPNQPRRSGGAESCGSGAPEHLGQVARVGWDAHPSDRNKGLEHGGKRPAHLRRGGLVEAFLEGPGRPRDELTGSGRGLGDLGSLERWCWLCRTRGRSLAGDTRHRAPCAAIPRAGPPDSPRRNRGGRDPPRAAPSGGWCEPPLPALRDARPMPAPPQPVRPGPGPAAPSRRFWGRPCGSVTWQKLGRSAAWQPRRAPRQLPGSGSATVSS